MKITIEADSREPVTVTREEHPQASETAESIDGGGPPQYLLQALAGESGEEEAVGEEMEPLNPEDAGGAPAWLVEIIQGSARTKPGESPGD